MEGEIRAADFENEANDERGEDAWDPGEREDGDDDEDAWDPSSTPGGSGGAGRRGDATQGARRTTPGGFRVADVPGSALEAARDPPGEGDAAIMRSLFGGGGTIRGGGVIRGAMNHDAIVNAAGARPPGGRERRRRGGPRRAASARRRDPVGPSAARVQRRRAHLDREIRHRGRAAARTGQQQRRRAVRPPWRRGGGFLSAPGVAGVAGASRHEATARRPSASAHIAPATRRRRRAVPTSSSPAPRRLDPQCSAEALLRDVVAFLRARPSGRAPSGSGRGRVPGPRGSNQQRAVPAAAEGCGDAREEPAKRGGRGGRRRVGAQGRVQVALEVFFKTTDKAVHERYRDAQKGSGGGVC